MTWYVKVAAQSPSGRVIRALYALYGQKNAVSIALRQFKEDFGDMPIYTITKTRSLL